jgi:hypothetical protein
MSAYRSAHAVYMQVLLCIAATRSAQLNLATRRFELQETDVAAANKGQLYDASTRNDLINDYRQAIGLLEMDESEAFQDHKAAAHVALSRLVLGEIGRGLSSHVQLKQALHMAVRACSLLGLELNEEKAESDRLPQIILQVPKLRQVLLCEALRCVGEARHRLAGSHAFQGVESHLANASVAMALSEAAALAAGYKPDESHSSASRAF